MNSSKSSRRKPASKGGSRAPASPTSGSSAKRRSRAAATRSHGRTYYAACWCDDYNCDFGIYKVFRSRGKCLDYLTDIVFERAENLEVRVRDQSKRYVLGENGEPVFPEMTRKEVRDQFEGGDFGLVLRTNLTPVGLDVVEQVSMGVREVEIE